MGLQPRFGGFSGAFFRFDYDAEMAMAVAHAAELPFVVLVPAGGKRLGQTAA